LSSYSIELFVNERSAHGQFDGPHTAASALLRLMETIASLAKHPRFALAWCHTGFGEEKLTTQITVRQCLRSLRKSDALALFLRLLGHGPYVDAMLRGTIPEHTCEVQSVDFKFTGIAGAAFFGTPIASFESPLFDNVVPADFSRDGTSPNRVNIRNLTSPQSAYSACFRKYVPSAKHGPGGWGTFMDLDDSVAAATLDIGVEVEGDKQVFSFRRGKFYVFQPDGTGGYHGYPVSSTEIPAKAMRLMFDVKLITQLQDQNFAGGQNPQQQ